MQLGNRFELKEHASHFAMKYTADYVQYSAACMSIAICKVLQQRLHTTMLSFLLLSGFTKTGLVEQNKIKMKAEIIEFEVRACRWIIITNVS